MSVTYNGTTIGTILYESTDISKGYYDSTEVFTKDHSEVLHAGFTLDSSESRVPGPYDENGYNYNGSAPQKRKDEIIVLDVTDYSSISFTWNNDGSGNAWGTVWARVEPTVGGEVQEDTEIFDTAASSTGTTTIDTSSWTGNVSFKFEVYAHSESAYGSYTSRTVLNAGDIMGNT